MIEFFKGDVRAEIALQLRRTKLYCVLLRETPLHQSRIVDRRNARSARMSPFLMLHKIYTLVELGLDHGSDRITLTDC